VRIKSGLYYGDLGLVEATSTDNKVWLRIIPRLDMNPKKPLENKSFTRN
jgi:hypothetical protein